MIKWSFCCNESNEKKRNERIERKETKRTESQIGPSRLLYLCSKKDYTLNILALQATEGRAKD